MSYRAKRPAESKKLDKTYSEPFGVQPTMTWKPSTSLK